MAALEYLGTLVDIDDAPADLVTVVAEFDERVVETVDVGSMPGWDATPSDASVRFGSQWIRDRRSVVLRVPSVMIPGESNFVLNPEHPDFGRVVRVGNAQSFAFDPRLLRRR